MCQKLWKMIESRQSYCLKTVCCFLAHPVCSSSSQPRSVLVTCTNARAATDCERLRLTPDVGWERRLLWTSWSGLTDTGRLFQRAGGHGRVRRWRMRTATRHGGSGAWSQTTNIANIAAESRDHTRRHSAYWLQAVRYVVMNITDKTGIQRCQFAFPGNNYITE